MLLKMLLYAAVLALSGCAVVPPFPPVNQCAYSVKFNKFRCCNTDTKVCHNLVRESPAMEGAQCLSADDYAKSERWVESVIQIAEQKCH